MNQEKGDKQPTQYTITVRDTASGNVLHEVTSDVAIVGVIGRRGKEDEFWCLYQGNVQGLNNLLSYMVFVVTGYINKAVQDLKKITEKKAGSKEVN